MHPTAMRCVLSRIVLGVGLATAFGVPATGQGAAPAPRASTEAPAAAQTPPAADTSTTHTLKTAGAAWPTDPVARAAAQEAARRNDEGLQLYQAGRRAEARAALEAAVAAAERGWGPDHPETALKLVNLGLVVRKLGDNRTAAAHYRRAIAIFETEGPSERLGVVIDNLARALQDLGDLDGALAATTRAIDVLSATLGPETEHVGVALNNLAMLLSAKGEHAKAADTCDKAVAILRKALGPNHPDLQPFLADQRELRHRAGR